MKFAKILCIEGGDKMGKETQTKMLVSHLETLGKNVTLVEVPYDDGMTHDIIYKMLKSGSAKDKPYVFQFVHFINKMIFQVCKLPTLLLKNDYVVLDRWSLSALVYGTVGGVDLSISRFLYRLLVKPHRVAVLSGEPFFREGSDVFEADEQFQARVRNLYRCFAADLPDHGLVNANQTRDHVHEDIKDYLKV